MSRGVLLLWLTVATAALAQDGDDEERIFEEEFQLLEDADTVYTASRHEEDLLDTPATVTVITRRQIENSHCLDITCLLRAVPEIEVRQMNPFHHSVGARALADELNDTVLLLIDGREDNIEALGMPLWQLTALSLEDIERIEVVRGPASALYGANAHSLVVNVTTRRPENNELRFFSGGGNLGRLSLGASASLASSQWKLQIRAGEHQAKQANRLQTSHQSLCDTAWLTFYAQRTWAKGVTSLDFSFLPAEGVLYALYSPTSIRNGHILRTYLQHQKDWLQLRAWHQLMTTESLFNVPLNYAGTKLGSFVEWLSWRNHAADFEVQATHSFFKDNLLVAGANFRFLSMYLESNRPETVYQGRLGVFLHDQQKLGPVTLSAGLRLDYNSITPFTASPRAALVWRYDQNQSLRLAFGRAFRKPAFLHTSMHITGVKPEPGFGEVVNFIANSIGNEKLGNENVSSFEAGWRGYFWDKTLFVEGDVFFNMYRDAIGFEFHLVNDSFGFIDLTRSWFRFENSGADINSAGGSLTGVWQWRERLRLSANYTYRYSWYLHDRRDSRLVRAGDRVAWEPAHLFNTQADLMLENGLRFGLSLHLRSSFWEIWREHGSLFGQEVDVSEPARALAGAYLSWRMGEEKSWLEAGLRFNNIFDERWRDLTSLRRLDGLDIGGWINGRVFLLFLRGQI